MYAISRSLVGLGFAAAMVLGGCGDSSSEPGNGGMGGGGAAGTSGQAGTSGSSGAAGTMGRGGSGGTAGTGGTTGTAGTAGAGGSGGRQDGGAEDATVGSDSGSSNDAGAADAHDAAAVLDGGHGPVAHAVIMPFGAGSTVVGTATFTTLADGVGLVVHLDHCPSGDRPIYIDEGTSCTSAATQGGIWGGTNGRGAGIGLDNMGIIDCTSGEDADLEDERMSTPADQAWTVGAPASSNVIGHVIVIYGVTGQNPTDRVACGVIVAN